ncbi:erythromycin esterase family protein [Streptomyces sp. DSM 41527]|uniref:Erythromycin esterase family protein n=1 Tax=Streptomyces mooreae TaxID=3075523 RepID=A0ABU2T8P3_9ACTN|nr:erythromycin esterase family protein [Streptomyces sp. DSM 41527]MDT0457297.1 erythromycin esterase family protein [Streptomyces sp. DSM 41527]
MRNDTVAPHDSLPAHAGSSGPRQADVGPLSAATLDELAEKIAAAATVVGIGESTRSSRETFGVRDQLFRRLVQDHGFRALAVHDSARIAAGLDRYVHAGEGDAASALDNAWRPWRTAEMAATLECIRGARSPTMPVTRSR